MFCFVCLCWRGLPPSLSWLPALLIILTRLLSANQAHLPLISPPSCSIYTLRLSNHSSSDCCVATTRVERQGRLWKSLCFAAYCFLVSAHASSSQPPPFLPTDSQTSIPHHPFLILIRCDNKLPFLPPTYLRPVYLSITNVNKVYFIVNVFRWCTTDVIWSLLYSVMKLQFVLLQLGNIKAHGHYHSSLSSSSLHLHHCINDWQQQKLSLYYFLV